MNYKMNLTTIVILSTACSVFFIISSLAIIYFFMSRRITQVNPSNQVYQSVPRDSGLSVSIELMLPDEIFCAEFIKDPCCICFSGYRKYRIVIGEYLRKLKCKHIFHSNCIEDWVNEKNINSFCPLCLKPIVNR